MKRSLVISGVIILIGIIASLLILLDSPKKECTIVIVDDIEAKQSIPMKICK